MKISPNNAQDYLRVVDSVALTKPDPVNKLGETVLDPQNRTVDQRPVEAPEHALDLASARPDKVDLSPIARASMIGQEKLQAALNAQIEEAFAVQGIDLSEHQGIDYAPDAVSQRIVDFSISLYGVFREQHPELSDAQALDKFEGTIRGAVDKGYGEAIEVLQAMNMPESVLEISENTKTQIDQRFDDYFEEQRAGRS